MTQATTQATTSGSGRIAALDVARGLALVGMGVYHLSWDLAYFGLGPPWLPYSPAMRIFSHFVASAFLGLVGVSFALAHPTAPRWRAFFARLGVIAAAAALVSLGTYFAAPQAPIWFGILHCILVGSLLAALFLRAPAWASLVGGAAMIAAPWILRIAAFNSPGLIWIGLGTVEPSTLDWRPLMPWAGVILVGLSVARMGMPLGEAARWRPRRAIGAGVAFAGRHSLAIYLAHQPILFALLFAFVNLSGVAARQQREHYLAACRPACVEAGGELAACAKACECVARRAEAAGLGAVLASHAPSENERRQVSEIAAACGSEAR